MDGSGFQENGVLPGYSVSGIGGFTRIAFSYDTGITIPLPLVKDIVLKNSIIYRGWTGCGNAGSPLGFEAMTASSAGNPVPRSVPRCIAR